MSDHHELCLLYHSGEIQAGRKTAFEAHLAGCPSCRELLLALGVAERVAGLAELPAPAIDAPAVLAAAESRGHGATSAVFVVLALAVLAVWPRGSDRVASWGELDRDLAALGAAVERLGSELARTETETEIDADFRALERQTRRGL